MKDVLALYNNNIYNPTNIIKYEILMRMLYKNKNDYIYNFDIYSDERRQKSIYKNLIYKKLYIITIYYLF